jgi:kynurenine formamidase
VPTRDCSHPLDSDATIYPGDPPVELTPAATHEDDGYRITEVRLGSHSGTHIDAPSHTEPDGRPIDAFDLSEFVFETRLVECAGLDAREAIELDDLPDELRGDSESRARANDADGTDDENEMLIFRTGWDAHWGTDRYFDHPSLSREVAAWCAERGYHVGLDVLSPDPTPSVGNEEPPSEGNGEPPKQKDADSTAEPDGLPAHSELLGRDRFVLENLTGLGDLPDRFELRAYPLPLGDGDGSPVRAVAVW